MELAYQILSVWTIIGLVFVIPPVVLGLTMHTSEVSTVKEFRTLLKEHPISMVFGIILSVFLWPAILIKLFK